MGSGQVGVGAGKGGEGEDRARQGLWGRRERLGLVMSGENAGGADSARVKVMMEEAG